MGTEVGIFLGAKVERELEQISEERTHRKGATLNNRANKNIQPNGALNVRYAC